MKKGENQQISKPNVGEKRPVKVPEIGPKIKKGTKIRQ